MSDDDRDTGGTRGTAALGEAPEMNDPHARAMLGRIRATLTGAEVVPVMIGRFEVERALGRGGMGVVYAARDPNLGRQVAIKVIEAPNASARERVLQEARALARLEHPAIVRVYEADAIDDGIYIAMELVDGVQLDRWLDEQRPDAATILRLFGEAAGALQLAHSSDVVHGDIKPSNLLVTTAGNLKVIDFGLARIGDRGTVGAAVLHDSPAGAGLTAAGAGTPAYMAPEQLCGERTDARSDQFSLAVALFEALAGQRPFAGAAPTGSTEEIGARVIDIHALQRTPPWLHPPLRRALAGDPADRYTGMTSFAAAITPPRHQRRYALFAGAAAIAMALGLFALTRTGELASPTASTATAEHRSNSGPVANQIPVAAVAGDSGPAVAAAPEVPTLATDTAIAQPADAPDAATATKRRPRARAAEGNTGDDSPADEPSPGRQEAPPPKSTPRSEHTASERDRILDPNHPAMLASIEVSNAARAENAGRPEACIRMLDRALAIDPGEEGHYAGQTRARCEMRLGKCGAGRRRYVTAWVAGGGSRDYAEREARRLSEYLCPATDGPLDDRLERLYRQSTGSEHAGRFHRCARLLTVADGTLAEARAAGEQARTALSKSYAYLSFCLADNGRCDDAARARAGYLQLISPLSAEDARQGGVDWAATSCPPTAPR